MSPIVRTKCHFVELRNREPSTLPFRESGDRLGLHILDLRIDGSREHIFWRCGKAPQMQAVRIDL
jgi:hypothetical protein